MKKLGVFVVLALVLAAEGVTQDQQWCVTDYEQSSTLCIDIVSGDVIGGVSDYVGNPPGPPADAVRLEALENAVFSLWHAVVVLKDRTEEAIQQCRVCFQEVEGSSQCQDARSSCSGWSSSQESGEWSLPFRDDTDDREGGCRYQWKLECR